MTIVRLTIKIETIGLLLFVLFMVIFKFMLVNILMAKAVPKCEKGEKFLAKLKEKFGDKFGLDEFVYESSTLPITLICPTHGAFSKLPNAI